MDLLHFLVDYHQSQLVVALAEHLRVVEEVGKGQKASVVAKPYLLTALLEGDILRERIFLFLPVALLELESILELRVV